MLLFRLCAKDLCVGLVDELSPFTDPSALLLKPWVVGDVCDMGGAIVWPGCGALAAAASTRGASTVATWLWTRLGEIVIGSWTGLLWSAWPLGL